jgi:hypothetical protein
MKIRVAVLELILAYRRTDKAILVAVRRDANAAKKRETEVNKVIRYSLP